MHPKDTLSPKYYYIEELGIRCPTTITPETFISGTKMDPGPDDVIVTTYPKCGTTWAQSILWMMTNDLHPCPDPQIIILDRFIDFQGKEEIEKIPREEGELRVTKTHYPQWCAPWNSQTKYIYVVRNPYDCAVSFYHHTTNFQHYNFKDEFSKYFEHFINGEVDWGCYFEHLVTWYKVKDEPNVLFLKFEDMKTDLKPELIKIGNFLGGKYKEMVENELMVEKILDGVNISNLHTQTLTGFTGQFFRNGIIGDWRKYFTDDMIERMNRKFDEYDQKYNIGEIWKDYKHLLPQ